MTTATASTMEYTIHKHCHYYSAYPPSLSVEGIMPFLWAETEESLKQMISWVKESPQSRSVSEWDAYLNRKREETTIR